MPIDQTPSAAIKQVGDELRARARVSGFQSPVVTQFAFWVVKLSFGAAVEMEKLKGLEALQREAMKLPPRPASARARDTWHLSVETLPEVSMEKAAELDPAALNDANTMLGMLVHAVGVPHDMIAKPIETKGRHGGTLMQWQWRDE